MTWLLTSAFTFTFTFVYVYAYAYAYACVCPVPLPMPGSVRLKDGFACYVSTHFRYILTTLVLIRNIFHFTTLKINAYLFFRRGYGKLIV